MRTIAENYKASYPISSKIILRDFYVDDMTSGANTLEDAQIIKKETSELLNLCGFPLRKWSSNIPSLRDNELCNKEFAFFSNCEHETRTLGIVWNCDTDELKFTNIPKLKPLENPTKRSILSRIALIHDP